VIHWEMWTVLNTTSRKYGQAAIHDLCRVLDETFNTLTQMTDRKNSNDLQPNPLPDNKKSMAFVQAVLKHSLAPSKVTDLVKGLQDMRSDIQMCLKKLDVTFQHARNLYDISNNGLARPPSRGSIFSTSTNLTLRVKLFDWLKRREGTWGLSRRHELDPVSRASARRNIQSHFDYSLVTFFRLIFRPNFRTFRPNFRPNFRPIDKPILRPIMRPFVRPFFRPVRPAGTVRPVKPVTRPFFKPFFWNFEFPVLLVLLYVRVVRLFYIERVGPDQF
jgi:hypothetical protein